MKTTFFVLCCALLAVTAAVPRRKTRPYTRSCRDYSFSCVEYKGRGFCRAVYVEWMRKNCRKTCGLCAFPTTPTPTTPRPTASRATCGRKGTGFTRIVGGTIAAPGDWPWQVTYDYVGNTGNPGHWCGASIISPHWIVTAAHCFPTTNTRDYKLTVGDFDIGQHEGHEQRMEIERIIKHENYNPSTFDYDIALMKLRTPIKYTSRVRPVCLPDDDMHFSANTQCYVTGWGKLGETGAFPKHLYQVSVPLVDRNECAQVYMTNHGYTITERMRCAGKSSGGIDACQGDSGGPLVCNRGGNHWYLMGAVSWGIGCARHNAYGVYADLTVLKPWIIKNMAN